MRLTLIGTSHKRAPIEVRERLSARDGGREELLRRLLAVSQVQEAALVSTCNRCEVLLFHGGDVAVSVTEELARWGSLSVETLGPLVYQPEGEEAAKHLFRVASSLDSLVLGEAQILGQVKEAWRQGRELGSIGPTLDRVFQKAFSVAKRVRTETRIGAESLSVAQSAVDLASQIFEDWARHTVLLLGAGEMGELALQAFRARGVKDLWITNRTMERAVEVAAPLGASVLPWERRGEFLGTADVVLCSTAAPEPVITPADVLRVRRARKGRPLFFIDISVPRNLSPALAELDGVYLYDVDDLGKAVARGRELREEETRKAEALVAQEAALFGSVLSMVHVEPLLRAVHRKTGLQAKEEAHRMMDALGPSVRSLSDAEREVLAHQLEKLCQGMARRLMADPLERIKLLGERGDTERLRDAAHLLGLQGTLFVVSEGEEPPLSVVGDR